MIILQAVKYFIWCSCFLPLAFAALATGLLFASYNTAVSKNPDESENLFNTTLMGFALIETFVFIGLILAVIVYYAL